jgi:hypothetical protein
VLARACSGGGTVDGAASRRCGIVEMKSNNHTINWHKP